MSTAVIQLSSPQPDPDLLQFGARASVFLSYGLFPHRLATDLGYDGAGASCPPGTVYIVMVCPYLVLIVS